MMEPPVASPAQSRPCHSPPPRVPMRSPECSPAPMSACSETTPMRRVATPVRSSCRRTAPAPQKEQQALTPRTLRLCDCGSCAVCTAGVGTIVSQVQQIGASMSPKLDMTKVFCFSDIATPEPDSPGVAPTIAPWYEDGLVDLNNKVVVEIPIVEALPQVARAASPSPTDPRKLHQKAVVLPAIPTDSSSLGASLRGKPCDPRARHVEYTTSDCNSTRQPTTNQTEHHKGYEVTLAVGPDPRRQARGKRRLSPTQLAPILPKCSKSPTGSSSAALRARRYRSPTPAPEPACQQ